MKLNIPAIIIIICGLIFSQLLIIEYTLYDGFFYVDTYCKIGSLIGFQGSNRLLTSRFIGYLLYSVFAIYTYKKMNMKSSRIFQIFTIVAICSFLYELRSIYYELNNVFDGQALQMGWPLFIMALVVYRDYYFNQR